MSFSKQPISVNSNDARRIKSLTSRMVGMYRLLSEQQTQHSFPVINSTDNSIIDFSDLRQTIVENVREKLLSCEVVDKILNNITKEQGSLKEMLFIADKYKFPEQTIAIRFGYIVSEAIKSYLGSLYTDVSDDLSPLIKGFLERNIHLDIAIRKDDTYFVSELKYNTNLDTEKTSKIVEKLDLLSIILKKFFGKNSSKVSFVSLRYPNSDLINNIKPELDNVKNQYILGYVDFFKLFGINVTQTEWETMHRLLGNEIKTTYINAYFNKLIEIEVN